MCHRPNGRPSIRKLFRDLAQQNAVASDFDLTGTPRVRS
jgi:hypothetical protein